MLQSLPNFTENTLQGNGVFDRLMNSVKLHIEEEFNKTRITGSSYAQAYIAIMQAVLQASTQITLESDKIALELEKLKLEIEKTKVELDIAKQQLELEKEKTKQMQNQAELTHWQAVATQAQVCDIIDNNEETYAGDSTNIHGILRTNLDQSKANISISQQKAMLECAKTLVIEPYTVAESAEGVSANYFGLNGANGIDILNAVRKQYGVTELDTDKYSGEHKQYMNTYAPDVTLESED